MAPLPIPNTCSCEKAAWGVVVADAWQCHPVASGRVTGILQTLGELRPLLCGMYVFFHKRIHLWSNNAAVVRRLQQILDGQQPEVTWTHFDPWLQLSSAEFPLRILSMNKVHSHQVCIAHLGDQWAHVANEAVDTVARIACQAWFPQEHARAMALMDFLRLQDQQLRRLIQPHVWTGELYTGVHGSSNRPPRPDALPTEVAPLVLPPSHQRSEAVRAQGQPTLAQLWHRCKRPAPKPPEDRRTKRARDAGQWGHRPALALAKLPIVLQVSGERLKAWREMLGLRPIQEVWPFLSRGWDSEAAPSWISWLELAVLYGMVMPHPTPLWSPARRR